NSLAVGDALQRANSAEANSGSRLMARSKCASESCARSFSARARPCKNSFLASADFVVTGIFPLSDGALAEFGLLVRLQALVAVTADATPTANKQRLKDFRRMDSILRVRIIGDFANSMSTLCNSWSYPLRGTNALDPT